MASDRPKGRVLWLLPLLAILCRAQGTGPTVELALRLLRVFGFVAAARNVLGSFQMTSASAQSALILLLLGVSAARSAHAQTTQPPTRAFAPLPPEKPAEQSKPEPIGPPPVAAATASPQWSPPQPTMDLRRDASPKDRWTDRPLLVELHVGFGTPFGAFGAAVARDVVRYFGLFAGAGIGESGPQLAAGGRARIPLNGVALGLELSWSGGAFHAGCHAFCLGTENEVVAKWSFAHWINLAPAVEFRTVGGFNARIYGGYGSILNDPDQPCSNDPSAGTCHSEDELGFLGAAFGFAF